MGTPMQGRAWPACRGLFVGSAWEEPRYPLHFGGDIGVGDGVFQDVTLLPGELVMNIDG